MTVISARRVTPLVGQEKTVMHRMLRMAGVVTRHGGNSRIAKIVAGAHAGSIEIWNMYENHAAAAKSFAAYTQDPEYLALMQERAVSPAADGVQGPNVARFAVGGSSGRPMIFRREWQVERSNLPRMIELAHEAISLVEPHGATASLIVPSMAEEHDKIIAAYGFNSMEHWGTVLDNMLADEKMQDLQNRVADLGKLVCSSGCVIVA